MQETQEFTLPLSGKKILVRGYMTGFIDDQIQAVMAAARKQNFTVTPEQVKESQDTGKDPTPSMSFEVDPTIQIQAKNKRLELMVTALDGNTGDILNRVLQLPKQDVKYILDEIAKVEGESKVEGSDPKAPNS